MDPPHPPIPEQPPERSPEQPTEETAEICIKHPTNSPSSDLLDPIPAQFPMPESWDELCGPGRHSKWALGCGVHDPRESDWSARCEHEEICIKGRTLGVIAGSEGPGRLHDALDLADRTCRRTRGSGDKPQKPAKRVRFSLDSAPGLFENSRFSYFATDAIHARSFREVDSIRHYYQRERCVCDLGVSFRSDKEHDKQVRERRYTCEEDDCSCREEEVFASKEEHDKPRTLSGRDARGSVGHHGTPGGMGKKKKKKKRRVFSASKRSSTTKTGRRK